MWGASVAAALLMAAAVAPAPALAGACPQSPGPVPVRIEVDSVRPTIDHSHSRARIHAIALETGVSSGWRNGRQLRTVGLTRGELGVGLQAESELRARGNSLCVVINRLTVRVGYRAMDILIPRKYPPDSCQYKTILAHEQEHVRINQDVLSAFTGTLKAEAARIAGAVNPIPVRTPREARTKPLALITERLRPVLEVFRADQARANAAIDTMKEYSRLKARCGHW